MRRAEKIAVLGGGAWGTALAAAQAAAAGSGEVRLYCRRAAQAEEINRARQNSVYLPNITLPRGLYATDDAAEAVAGADIILAVFPAQGTRAALTELKAHIPPRAPLVFCSKGIERATGKFMTQIGREILPDNPPAVLSGPSFAADVARGLPTAVSLAAETEDLAEYLAGALSSPAFRLYACADIIGVETGGALKNVPALAAGMASGRGLGASAQAAIITRGFAELRRICASAGGRAETMSSLAVLGDLVLTCSSPQSRNYSYGAALAKGEDLTRLPLAEGVATAPAAARLCRRLQTDAPLIFAVAAILAGELSFDEAARQILARPLKFED